MLSVPRTSNDLFIGLVKPHKQVTLQTLSRWLVNILQLSGIYITKFHAHSFRHSSTSKASQVGVNVDTILKRVGWPQGSKTFAKFYNRPFESTNFAEAVLSIN